MRLWRKLHNGIIGSTKLSMCSLGARWLFTLLVVAQDDAGRYPWDETKIRQLIAGVHHWKSDDVQVYLEELVANNLAVRYEGYVELVEGEDKNGVPSNRTSKPVYYDLVTSNPLPSKKDFTPESLPGHASVTPESPQRDSFSPIEKSRVEESRSPPMVPPHNKCDKETEELSGKPKWYDILANDERFNADAIDKVVDDIEGTYGDLNLVMEAHACYHWLQTNSKGKRRKDIKRTWMNWLKNTHLRSRYGNKDSDTGRNPGQNQKSGSGPEVPEGYSLPRHYRGRRP